MRGLTLLNKDAKVIGIDFRTISASGKMMKTANYRQNSKSAIIAESSLGYGLSRMYQVACDITNLDEVKVFRENERDRAIAWLDVQSLAADIDAFFKERLNYQ
ncbi:hypothetical protein D8Y20_11750 [Mariprofundus sp. EBB-1]|nr:hypothetical protein D8Y20_11750 [Mariprofundus sp. EBB-1]